MRRVSAPGSTVLIAGAGTSALAIALANDGARSLIAADISASALEQLSDQLGSTTSAVRMSVGDICDIEVTDPVDVWHDRAVFHFLNDPVDQERYARTAAGAVRPGGHLVIATFSPTGPEQCSGLPVTRYSAVELGEIFAHDFRLVDSFERDHLTPWNATQSFTHAVLERIGDAN